jgi:hypothetical protein
MTSATRRVGADLSATSTLSPLGQSACRDDLEIARQRMRHLVRWNVQPVPMIRTACAAATNPVSAAEKERCKHLVLKVLGLHMGYAQPTSALS